MRTDKVSVSVLNQALILSLELDTNNLSLYIIELGADLGSDDVKNAINNYTKSAYDDSMYLFSERLKEKVRAYTAKHKTNN